MNISKEEKIFILKLARQTIKNYFSDEKEEIQPEKDYPVLKQHNGIFVTLKSNGRLRGCIGYILSDKPLLQTIKDASIQAAYHDPRFNPLTEKEYKSIKLEISVLSEPFKMNSYDEIDVGEHGLIVNENGHRGLLLPQVPIEHDMNKEEYLSALCQKAGLPQFYWKEKTLKIEMFTAEVFSEEEMEL